MKTSEIIIKICIVAGIILIALGLLLGIIEIYQI